MIEAEVGKRLNGTLCFALLPLLLSVCMSDVVSYRLVRPLGWLCDSSGVSAPAPASASARMRSLLAAQCRELPGVKPCFVARQQRPFGQ
jgi:hypothetical protein